MKGLSVTPDSYAHMKATELVSREQVSAGKDLTSVQRIPDEELVTFRPQNRDKVTNRPQANSDHGRKSTLGRKTRFKIELHLKTW